ncbi:hypothetical protein AB9K35_00245 [Leisingera sp. XS_AS12]|uniref:hypothetical protein n=1 Tax=Leisingera sp. XS_AS12 TaxID=3241294 RepID=UPI0035114AB1
MTNINLCLNGCCVEIATRGRQLTKLSKYNASGSMAGYLFQCRLALLKSLKLIRRNPDAIISVEKFDDIAFENADYADCLIQAKHHVQPKSLGDKSVDLWKTLLIWMEGAQHGIFELSKTTYVLITTASCPPNSAMERLREGASKTDIDAAYDLLSTAAESSKSDVTSDARTAFLKMTPDEAKLLLSRITVIDQHPNLTVSGVSTPRCC